MLATISVLKAGRKHNKILGNQETDHGQTELGHMLVKKNVLNEIYKEGTQGFKDCRKIKRKVPSKLTVKVKSVKATEKAWLFYEFSFSLNPGDKPIDAQA